MPVDPSLAGRTFAPTAPYLVSREKILEFTAAIGAEPIQNGMIAPVTFPTVIAFLAMTSLVGDPAVGIELRNVIHGDQRFEQARPVQAGDELTATLTIDTVRAAAGMDMLGTHTEIATVAGEQVCTSHATLVHRKAAR